MFEHLPLGALVSEKMLVIHGGLGDGTWGLRELEVCTQSGLRPTKFEFGQIA